MSKSYQVYIVEDPQTGELVLPLPDELLVGLGWYLGDILVWTIHDNGDVLIKKKQ